MVNPPEYDDLILQKLEELPEKWNSDQKEIKINLIVSKHDALMITSIIYDEVDNGIINTKINANHSKHSIDLAITLTVNVDLTPIIATLSLLLYEIKTKTISSYLSRKRKKREDKVKN